MIVRLHAGLKHFPANAEDMGTMHWAAAAAEGTDDGNSNLGETVSCCCCMQDASMEAFFTHSQVHLCQLLTVQRRIHDTFL